MKLLNIDGKFYAFLDMFWNVLKLNFLWLIFSLPVVTIGCSTVAAYSVTLKMVEKRDAKVGQQFLQAFRENWKQGLPMGLIVLLVSYSVFMNWQLFQAVEGNPILFLLFAILLGAAALSHFTYAFALTARYHNSIVQTFRNSAAISRKYFLHTLLLWLILSLLTFLFLFNQTLLFIGILIGPTSMFLTVSGFAVKFFGEIEKEQMGDA
ncbi:MAG: YesL family protein [Bacillota bacterium]|jgi:uncharacterized membrane protein YesL|nr:YesL family protein [Bacillota bacterium]HHT90240.1 YesL family protein [Bacillota bacterium]